MENCEDNDFLQNVGFKGAYLTYPSPYFLFFFNPDMDLSSLLSAQRCTVTYAVSLFRGVVTLNAGKNFNAEKTMIVQPGEGSGVMLL